MLKELLSKEPLKPFAFRLNPYFNGTCSKRPTNKFTNIKAKEVLILILMEHAQRVGMYGITEFILGVLS